MILQQTRVAQGIAYYERFVAAMPNVSALSEASESEVLKLWQGLGYYSRARNLHFAAKQVMQDFEGVFPSNYTDILKLRGVGKYTGPAITVTSAPASCAARAIAKPIFPLDKFVMPRTGSMAS